MEKKTKTLLIINIQDVSSFIIQIKQSYDIKEIYNIPNNNSLLFVIFFNIKDSERCHKDLLQKGIKNYFTISKYELPKDQEKCDKGKNQSTLFISPKNLLDFNEMSLKQYGEVREVRNANPTTFCVEFFDSRSADKCFDDFSSQSIPVKYVWDMSTKTKWDIIKHTDSVISQILPLKKKKTCLVNKNMFIKEFDDFIAENIDEIYKEFLEN